MTKNEFIKQMRHFFSSKGFFCKGRNYYKEITSEVMIVFGTQASIYGGYCYLEYGYCFKSINKYLPYPKHYQLNLNCGRIMTCNGQAIKYEDVDESFLEDLKERIDTKNNEMMRIVALGRDGLIKYYLSGAHSGSWYILGKETADYFGLPTEAFLYHIVFEE